MGPRCAYLHGCWMFFFLEATELGGLDALAVSAKPSSYEPHASSLMSPAVFARQKLVNLHKLWLLRGPFCSLWFHAWAERHSLNNQAWVMSPSSCWRGRNQVLHQAVSQLPRASSRFFFRGMKAVTLARCTFDLTVHAHACCRLTPAAVIMVTLTLSLQTTSPLCITLPWRELFVEPLRWTGLFPSLSGIKKTVDTFGGGFAITTLASKAFCAEEQTLLVVAVARGRLKDAMLFSGGGWLSQVANKSSRK